MKNKFTKEQLNDTTTKGWEYRISTLLLNKRITEVRYLTEKEAEHMGFRNHPIVIWLDDGNFIIPSRDDEGNDGGAMFTSFEEEQVFPVIHSHYYKDNS